MIEKMYYVKWVDSGFSLSADIWQTMDEVKTLLDDSKIVETVGFLLLETDDWIVLGQSVNQNLVRGGYFVYKKNIIEMKLKEVGE